MIITDNYALIDRRTLEMKQKKPFTNDEWTAIVNMIEDSVGEAIGWHLYAPNEETNND